MEFLYFQKQNSMTVLLVCKEPVSKETMADGKEASDSPSTLKRGYRLGMALSPSIREPPVPGCPEVGERWGTCQSGRLTKGRSLFG